MAISKLILNGEVQMDVTSDTVAANKLLSGETATKNDGTKVTGSYVPPTFSTQTKTVSPTEATQNVTPDTGYNGLSKVTVNPISSTYIGSGVTQRSSTDLTVSGATITAPNGYYPDSASKSVATMTLPTTTSTSATSGYTAKATLDRSTSDRYLNISPGYNSAGGYYKINKVANGSVTAPSSISGTSATVSTGTNTLTLTKSVSVTPNVTTAGYISNGTAGNSSVSLTASVTTKGASTITPSTSEQSIAAGTYLTGKQTISAMPNGTAGTPTITVGALARGERKISASVTNTAGYIDGGTLDADAVYLDATSFASGSRTITENGTFDVTGYESAVVNVPSTQPTIQSLTVTPSTIDQVFTGAYPGINLGVLSFRKTGTYASFSIDLSEIEYGETYHIQCDLMTVGNDGQYYNYIKIDTDWVASENGTVPFEYISHANWNVTSIKLSKSAITVAVSTGRSTIVNIGGSSAYTPTDFIVSKAGTVDGYNPVTVNAMPNGTAGTPTITVGALARGERKISASVTNTAGYIDGGTLDANSVYLSAAEFVTGSKTITENGTFDVTGYESAVVNVSGGGGGGLVYETGTYTPSSDSTTPYIYFTDTHSTYPIYINIVDVTETLATENSMLSWTFVNWYDAFNSYFKGTSSTNYYGRYLYQYKTSSGVTRGENESTTLTSNSGGLYYLLDNTMFAPYSFGSNRYWRSGRTYKWIAVWAPTV